ncbi:hypothetical protein GCM10010914_14580 [Deinococcus wulumuqiensis]|uniref:Translocation and assembly module TamB C-terminal domain-containing protein n=1 Tax=Deinococcus wulumuqiensis TaxID=980427 RepID=A0AAV4K3U8_9DEIO|nr:hypothetical protein GCM10010914_14580 [Deinococcus wulumuqiensis]GGP30804.1 hypothetical protein GCM10008021_24550 [Deinococcus wulumuqiensis]
MLGGGLLLGAVAYAPLLIGGQVLSRYGDDLGLSAGGVSGPLWSPKLSQVAFKQPGVQVTAGQAGVNVAGVDWRTRTVRVNVVVADAEVALRLRDLVGGAGGGNGASGGWQVVLGSVDVRRSRLTVDGDGINVPDARLSLSPGPDGAVAFAGRTPDGQLSGQLRVTERGGANVYAVTFDADARILRHYWGGVEAGRLQGRYVFGPGPVEGDVKLTGGLLRVPDAEFVTVRQVSGRALHRGDDVTLKLSGRAWDGPVTARGGADLRAEHWTVTLDADPTVAGLARSLRTTGQGDLKLRVTAGGWSTVRVKGYVKAGDGADGATFAGVPLRRARAEYTFLNRDGDAAPQTNDLAFSALTQLAGNQELGGRWAFGRAGTAAWKGDFAGKPLDLAARINAANIAKLSGMALGGAAQGSYDLGSGQLSAVLNPDYGAARARVVLGGRADDLRAEVTQGRAGPLGLTGTARLSSAGLRADLNTGGDGAGERGQLSLDLDPAFRGRWKARNVQASDLSLGGLTLGGQGTLDLTEGDLAGDLTARVPGVDTPLSGPVKLNYLREEGRFVAGEQRLTWEGDSFGLRLRDLAVLGGVKVGGDVLLTPPGAAGDLRATGQLTARGQGYDLAADLRGNAASLRGTAGGVTVLADSDLNAPYRTTARLSGSDVSGVLSLEGGEQPGVRFTLRTANDAASGVLRGQSWDAAGRVNLAALRPLLPGADLGGTLDLNLRGLGGGARANARVGGADVTGTLTRQPGAQAGGVVVADLTAGLGLGGEKLSARLRGRVFPDVQVGGAASYLGQTLQAAVSGPYGNLGASLRGRTGELSFGGVTLPAQTVDLGGTLTPELALSGRWGDLNASYHGSSGLLRVSGAQTLSAFGQTGRVQGQASWGPGAAGEPFRGAVDARGQLDQYAVTLRGPWRDLNVLLTDAEGLRASGTASLPAGRYDLDVSGPLTLPGQGTLIVDGRIQGTGTRPRGTLSVTDPQGGQGRLRLDGFDDLDLDLGGLTLAGQRLSGTLSARGGVLAGRLRAGPLDLVAAGGQVRAAGTFGGQRVQASARLTLPATLSDLRVVSDGPYFNAQASGDPSNLRGSLTLRAQTFGTGAARLSVPAQTFPLSASLTGARARVGGLLFQGGRWSGGLNAAYALQTGDLRQPGRVRLVGQGDVLAALPSGPLRGRVGLLPDFGGEVSTSLAPWLAALPPDLRATIRPGELVARVTETGAEVRLRQTLYQNEPLSLTARASWQGGLRASGLLSRRGLRLPVTYDGQDLRVRGARLDARLLSPLLPGVSGEVGLDLSVPGLDWQRADGAARVNVWAQGEQVTGTLGLRGGALNGNLQAGPLRVTASGGQVQATGEFAGHTVKASGRVTLPGDFSGLRVNVSGPYVTASAQGDLKAMTGTLRLREQEFGGPPARVVVPAQSFPLRLRPGGASVTAGGLTYAGGRWSGGLDAAYALYTGEWKRAGRVRLAGGGNVLAALPSGPLNGRVGLLPTLGGEVSTDISPLLTALPAEVRSAIRPGELFAKVTASGAELRLNRTLYQNEPLNLSAAVNWQGRVRASGLLSHPAIRAPLSYDRRGLRVDGARLTGRALSPLLPGVTGAASLSLNVPGEALDWARASGHLRADLTAQGQRVAGDLRLRGGDLNGDLQAGPLRVTANRGEVQATGEFAGHTLRANGRLTLPGDFSGLRVNVAGPYVAASAQGDLSGLRGTLTLREQGFGGGPARLVVPAQSFPLRASVTAGRVQVSDLRYVGGRWSGGLDAAYALYTGELKRTGRVRLAGGGNVLAALPSGPLKGRVGLLPTLGGEVSTNISPLLTALPAEVRSAIRPGELFAKVTASGAELRLNRTLYQNEPLNLTAAVNWQGGVRASGLLTHPGTRLPLEYDGRDLRVTGAVLSGRALRPVLPGAAGQARLDLTLPGLDWQRASGAAQLGLTAPGQRAEGLVTLRAGQLVADLASTLGGQDLRLSGPLYPQADAVLTLRGVSGTLTGDAARALTLRARGRFEERDLDLVVTGQGLTGAAARAEVQATLDGAALTASLRRGAGEGLAAWSASGQVQVPDLRALTGAAGRLNATFQGTLADLRGEAAGEVSGIRFTAPAHFSAGALRVSGLRATLPAGQGGGAVQASGTVWPELALSARTRLTDTLPGEYAAQVGGTLNRPDVQLSGRLDAAPSGLDAAGTRLDGHLLGPDWRLTLGGERLSGTLRGQFGSGAAGGLLTADLRLNTRYRGGAVDVGLTGPLAWNARQGWKGSVRAVGDVPGGPLDAMLDGRGPLALAGTLGSGERQAAFTGTLPAALPLKPGGELTLEQVDAGAFWNRPGQLRASGRATLGGASWSGLTVAFAGRLDDAAGELSGDVQARVGGAGAELRLTGPAVQGAASLRGGQYAATLKTQGARSVALARLLPANLGLSALSFGGTLDAAGTLAGGPERLRLRGARLRGEHAQAGPFSLSGSAEYDPRSEVLTADLRGSLRGGHLSASGALPGGLNVTLRDVAAAYPGAASFGQGTLGGALTLRGGLRDPLVAGQLGGVVRTEQGSFDTRLTLAGPLRRPDVTARVQASGQASGTLYAEARNLDPARPAGGSVRVYGTLRSGTGPGAARVQADLRGPWPRLGGELSVFAPSLPDALTLRGDGQGAYALSAGKLGRGQLTLTPDAGGGLVPRLAGRLDLTPLALVEGAEGEAKAGAVLGGTLAAPTVQADLTTRNVRASGAEVPDLRGTVSGTLSRLASLSGTFTQAGTVDPVARWQGQTLTLSGLNVRVAGSAVAASGTAALGNGGSADLTLATSGALTGQLRARYAAGTLSAAGTLRTAALGGDAVQTALDVRRSAASGWSGSARVTGGPGGVLTEPLDLRVTGDAAHPLLTGEGGLLGARARVVANVRGVQLRLVDGPGATANGLVELRPGAQGEWTWSGAASLTRPELAFSVTPSGPLADPQALLTLRRGEWRASGTASLSAADLTVSDGEREGRVTWDGEQARADLPGLDLTRLGVGGVSGRVTASGEVSRDQNGAVRFEVTGMTAPQALPLLGLTPAGDLSGTLTLSGGRPSVQALARLNAGTLSLDLAQRPGEGGAPARWQGRLGGTLRRGDGQLDLDVRTAATGLSGGAELRAYPLDVSGQTVTASGQLTLDGQSFTAALTAANGVGRARLSAEGGIGDALPAAEKLLGVSPTGEGYSARAVLDAVELGDLKLAPDLSGKVYGEANLSDGGGTFFLASDALEVGERQLPLRIEGSQVAGSWRLRGFLDRSDFTAGLSGGEVFGQGTLQALPLGAVLSAFAGSTPGEGVVTGVARFRFPLADPLAGTASVVAERIRVSARRTENGQTVTETLTGSGSLDYAARELRSVNVQLAGAGTWDVRGQYTRDRVDVNARFTDTTFTPVLQLVPGLADLDPSLRGTVVLSAAGTYDRPRGLLRAENVSGRVAGLTVQVPSFAGDLPDSGAFTAGGRVLTGGSVGSDGKLDVRGQLTLGRLSGTVATFSGLFAPEALGPLPNTTATLRQQSEREWTLDAVSRSTNPVTGAGTLTLAGQLTPRWDLNLQARNYNLPVSAIYARESALTGDFQLRDGGDFVRVSGEGDFARLVLGRVDAPDTLPEAPGTPAQTPGEDFASPLPEEYTTFPKPQPPGGDAAPGTGPATPGTGPATPLLERFLFEDVRLRASGGIRLDENLARAEFSTPGLVVSGTAARPQVRGQIVSQRGSVFLRENEFVITRSDVTFSGAGLYPTFTLTARGTVPSPTTRQRVPVALDVTGRFRTTDGLQGVLDLDTRLSCAEPGPQCRDPETGTEYGQAELYALVATGVPDLNNLGSNLAGLGSSALQTALNVFFLGELERTLARGLGVDVLRLTPALGTDGNVNATLTVGSYLTRELFVQYQVDLSGNGLIDATYSTPDGRFTFRVSTPLNGLDLQSVRPNFNVAYNVNPRVSFSVGLQNTAGRSASAGVAAQPESTQLRFGVTYRIGGR